MTAEGDTSLRAVEESAKNHKPVDPNLCLVHQASVDPNTFVHSTK